MTIKKFFFNLFFKNDSYLMPYLCQSFHFTACTSGKLQKEFKWKTIPSHLPFCDSYPHSYPTSHFYSILLKIC